MSPKDILKLNAMYGCQLDIDNGASTGPNDKKEEKKDESKTEVQPEPEPVGGEENEGNN